MNMRAQAGRSLFAFWDRCDPPPEPGFARREAHPTRGKAGPVSAAGGSAATRTTCDARKEGVRGGTRGSPTRDDAFRAPQPPARGALPLLRDALLRHVREGPLEPR